MSTVFQKRLLLSDKLDPKQVAEFLSTELAEEMDETNLCIVTQSKLDPAEVFAIGAKYGQEKERADWEKPEELHLENGYAKLLQEACKQYSKEVFVVVNSISFAPASEHVTKVIVKPTQLRHLFNIVLRYGKLLEKAG